MASAAAQYCTDIAAVYGAEADRASIPSAARSAYADLADWWTAAAGAGGTWDATSALQRAAIERRLYAAFGERGAAFLLAAIADERFAAGQPVSAPTPPVVDSRPTRKFDVGNPSPSLPYEAYPANSTGTVYDSGNSSLGAQHRYLMYGGGASVAALLLPFVGISPGRYSIAVTRWEPTFVTVGARVFSDVGTASGTDTIYDQNFDIYASVGNGVLSTLTFVADVPASGSYTITTPASVDNGIISTVEFTPVANTVPLTSGLQTGPPPSVPGDPNASFTTPSTARAFADSVNVNIHTLYNTTPYGNNTATNAKLVELGIKAVRDQYPLTNDTVYDYAWQRSQDRYNLYGIKTAFIMDPTVSGDTVIRPNTAVYGRDKIIQFGLLTATLACLSPNEWDRNSTLLANLVTECTKIYQAVKGSASTAAIPVGGPNLANRENATPYQNLAAQGSGGNLNAICDFEELHWYWGDRMATDSGVAQSIDVMMSNAGIIKPGKAPWIGETGYTTGSTAIPAGNWAVSEAAQAIRGIQIFCQHFRRGVPHTFWYELYDQHASTDFESNLGMVRNDNTNKPLGNAVKYMLGLFANVTTVPVTTNEFGYYLTGTDANTRTFVLKESASVYWFVGWQQTEVQSGSNLTLLNPANVSVVLKPPVGTTWATTGYRPNNMTSQSDAEYVLASGVTNAGGGVTRSFEERPLFMRIAVS